MEAVLIRRKVWMGIVHVVVENAEEKDEEAIEKELKTLLNKRDTGKMAEARAELFLCVEASQLAHMHSQDPQDILLTLQCVHCAPGLRGSIYYLKFESVNSFNIQQRLPTVNTFGRLLCQINILVSQIVKYHDLIGQLDTYLMTIHM